MIFMDFIWEKKNKKTKTIVGNFNKHMRESYQMTAVGNWYLLTQVLSYPLLVQTWQIF